MTVTPREESLALIQHQSPGAGADGWAELLERCIVELFEPDSYLPIDAPGSEASGYATAGLGRIGDKQVLLVADRLAEVTPEESETLERAGRYASEIGCPVVLLLPGEGHRSRAEPHSLRPHVRRMVRLSGVVPQIVLTAGRPFGPAKVLSDLADFTGHIAAADWVRDLLGYLPANNCEFALPPGGQDCGQALETLIPAVTDEPHTVSAALEAAAAEGLCVEVAQSTGKGIATAFIPVAGQSVGVLANRPEAGGGVITADDARKAARFIRFCDTFNISLLFLVDAAAVDEGDTPSHSAYAQLAFATSEASVPSIAVITGRAYGLAAEIFGGKGLGMDLVVALPTALIAPAGAHAMVARDDPAPSPSQRSRRVLEETRAAQDHSAARRRGVIDLTCDDEDQLPALLDDWLDALRSKRRQHPARKHGNVPL